MTSEPGTPPRLTTAIEAAERLNLGALSPEGPGASSRFMVRLLRRLASGEPVAVAEALGLAQEMDAAAAKRLLNGNAERDEGGNVVGAVGLSLGGHPHGFKVAGVDLQAWCAWDTFFLPQILGATGEVMSHDPVTGEQIALTISPKRVERSPDGVVVSVVYPDLAGCDSPSGIQELFCGFVQFFSSVETAQRWFADRDIAADLLTPDEAFVLGSILFAELIAARKALDEA